VNRPPYPPKKASDGIYFGYTVPTYHVDFMFTKYIILSSSITHKYSQIYLYYPHYYWTSIIILGLVYYMSYYEFSIQVRVLF